MPKKGYTQTDEHRLKISMRNMHPHNKDGENIMDDETARKNRLLKQLQDFIFSNAKTERLRSEFEGNLCGFLKIDDLPVTMDTYIDVRQGSGKFLINITTIEKIILEATKKDV